MNVQWFEYYFGNGKEEKKIDKDSSISSADNECSSCSCNSTTTDAVSTDEYFRESNKISLEDDMSFDDLISSENLTCVKFTASWCKPCKNQEPEIVKLAERMSKLGSKMRFVCVDVDLHDELFASLQIVGIPHIRLYRRSKLLKSFTGESIAGLEEQCIAFDKKNQ